MRITDEQIKRAGLEGMLLLKHAKDQLEEHKRWLTNSISQIGREGRLIEGQAQSLIADVDDIVLRVVKPEPILTEDGKPTLTVAYDYPDGLYNFLASSACPAELHVALDGAIVVEKKELDG